MEWPSTIKLSILVLRPKRPISQLTYLFNIYPYFGSENAPQGCYDLCKKGLLRRQPVTSSYWDLIDMRAHSYSYWAVFINISVAWILIVLTTIILGRRRRVWSILPMCSSYLFIYLTNNVTLDTSGPMLALYTKY